MNLLKKIETLFAEQTQSWKLAKENYEALKKVRHRSFSFDGFDVKVQFNPARIISTSAKTTTAELAKRPCFLCENNRPSEQKKIVWRDYDVLVNPFPIADKHFTIVKQTHQPQRINLVMEDFVDLATQLTGYAVFYNGPRCGASAPDHLHFQALPAAFLPLIEDYDGLKRMGRVQKLKHHAEAEIYQLNHYLRTTICVEAPTQKAVVDALRYLYGYYADSDEEPMMNLVCVATQQIIRLFVFPRKAFRPWQYSTRNTNEQLLISPATVEMTGMLITPREEDFNKLTDKDVLSIYQQISMPLFAIPQIRVGIVKSTTIIFAFNGDYRCQQTGALVTGEHTCEWDNNHIKWNGQSFEQLNFIPQHEVNEFVLANVRIGIDFHWEREESQSFRGTLELQATDHAIQVVNGVDIETYLESVISSEMSANASTDLLKAHAIVSRSWLMHPLLHIPSALSTFDNDHNEWIKWYERDAHVGFDVCADDHCQRYQGVTRITRPEVKQAIRSTTGIVLTYHGEVCDTRFSKSCGGLSERFENCWDPIPHPYLSPVRDNVTDDLLDLTQESNARRWILSRPEAFCETKDEEVLKQVLNDYDRELPDTYRWKVSYSQNELSELIARKSGMDFGTILLLEPLQRGPSGRIIRLRIKGEKMEMIVGKELEIRRWLSPTHLYSSAFVVERTPNGDFLLIGAGWGHGVGLCQIGAAVMAHQGYDYRQILKHYFPNTQFSVLWGMDNLHLEE